MNPDPEKDVQVQLPEGGPAEAGKKKKRKKRGQAEDVFKKGNFVYQVHITTSLCVCLQTCVVVYLEISSDLSGLQKATAQYIGMLTSYE